jgi:hypothetical protein
MALKVKTAKIVNCQNCQKTVLSQLEKVGGHRYPSGSLEHLMEEKEGQVGEALKMWVIWT